MPSKIERESNLYKAKLDRTMTDGKVTTKEADALIKNAHDGHFTELEAHYLSAFIDRSKRKFDPAAREKLVAFAAGEMQALAKTGSEYGREGTLSNPKLNADSIKAGTTYDKRDGQVAVNGFNYDDPLQGNVGDCYFISSLASVAKSHPELLEKAVKTNRDGTYTVTFHERNPGETTSKPVQVTIDGSFANRHGRLEYAAARETRELWPLIFEKAYAAWKGGFPAIEGGMAATTLEALTGAKGDFFTVNSSSDPKAVYQKLTAALADKGCVIALSKTWDPSEQGIVADHAYTLLGVETQGGKQYVQLRNPWGEREPGHDGRDDGVFRMPIEQFLTSFATVEFAKP
jgi:hypothetical protein